MITNKSTAQGSIISPNEYIIYLNQMCNLFEHGSVYQFADDTCLLVPDEDIKIGERARPIVVIATIVQAVIAELGLVRPYNVT